MSVTAVIPAHNEAATIAEAVRVALAECDDVIVVADNCTDETASLAAQAGATVAKTQDNASKKAGALNQVLPSLLLRLADDDFILVQDADSVLDPGFVAAALAEFEADPGLGGVSGTFRGDEGGGFVGMLQRNEYARYARDIRQLHGRALVLTGTAAIFPVAALSGLLAARGYIYDVEVLTEDNELTLALLHAGYRILAPEGCTLTTEVMPTWGDLARQRLRWKRGAFENLAQYGLTSITAAYWGRQALSLLGVIATFLYLGSMALTPILGFALHPFWLALTTIFIAERVVTVRSRGYAQQALAALLVVEFVYDVFLQVVQARAFAQVALRRPARW